MVYLEYERYKDTYHHAQERFAQVLMEKERLFTKTQPNAIRYDKEQIQTSIDGNILEEYVVSMDEGHIEDKLNELRQAISDWEILLELKERELRKSQDKFDKVYTLKYMDGYGVNRICKQMNYSRSQVYKILNQISKRCDKMRLKK